MSCLNERRLVSLSNSAPHLTFRLYRLLTNVVRQTRIPHRCAPPPQSLHPSNRSVLNNLESYAPRKCIALVCIAFIWLFLNCYTEINSNLYRKGTTIFWDVTRYSLVEVGQIFRGTCRHTEGRSVSRPSSKQRAESARCEVLTAVVMKSFVFWDITQCRI
jgi:hypothetical protein